VAGRSTRSLAIAVKTPWLSLFIAGLFGVSAHLWRPIAMPVSMVFVGLLVGPFVLGCLIGGILGGISPARPLSVWGMFIVGLFCSDVLFYWWFGQWPISGVIAVMWARDHQALYLGTLLIPAIRAMRAARRKGNG
jgi:hypothetical protein